MRIPHIVRIGALILATTGFYTYVGQMVPQKEVQPPEDAAIGAEMTTADMVKVGRQIMTGKGLCLTCHTVGKTGALRFPDLQGVAVGQDDFRKSLALQDGKIVFDRHPPGIDIQLGQQVGDAAVLADDVTKRHFRLVAHGPAQIAVEFNLRLPVAIAAGSRCWPKSSQC